MLILGIALGTLLGIVDKEFCSVWKKIHELFLLVETPAIVQTAFNAKIFKNFPLVTQMRALLRIQTGGNYQLNLSTTFSSFFIGVSLSA